MNWSCWVWHSESLNLGSPKQQDSGKSSRKWPTRLPEWFAPCDPAGTTWQSATSGDWHGTEGEERHDPRPTHRGSPSTRVSIYNPIGGARDLHTQLEAHRVACLFFFYNTRLYF